MERAGDRESSAPPILRRGEWDGVGVGDGVGGGNGEEELFRGNAAAAEDAEAPPGPAGGGGGSRGSGGPARHRLSASSGAGGSWRIGVGGLASSNSSLSSLDSPVERAQAQLHQSAGGFRPRRREMMAWVVVALQAAVIAFFSLRRGSGGGRASYPASSSAEDMLRMNGRPNERYERQRQRAQLSQTRISADGGVREPFYESPIVHPRDAGLVQRTWRSNGSPLIHGDLKSGSCWCSADEWCMCTPSMAVDVILRSGSDHVWMVRRADTGKLALMGGMIEVGETAEQAVHRELREEMNLVLPPSNPPALFGVYSDPVRDARRHSASVVYVVDVPPDAAPRPGDDATEVVRIALDDIDHRTFFVDHRTMLRDYRAAVASAASASAADGGAVGAAAVGTAAAVGSEAAPFAPGEPVRRSVCPPSPAGSG